jgi:hypothetical protein
MLQFRYQRVLRRMSFQKTRGIPFELGLSSMFSIIMPAYSIMKDGISLTAEDSTTVNDLDGADGDQTTNYSRIQLHYFLGR